MWPFKSRPLRHRVSAMENAINSIAVSVNQLVQHANEQKTAIDPAIVATIVNAGLEREKLAIVGRNRDRTAANSRPRGDGGRFQKRNANGKDPHPCRACINPGEPTLTADEIWFHGTGHTARLPKEFQ